MNQANSRKLKVVFASVTAGGGHNSIRDMIYEQFINDDRFEVVKFDHPRKLNNNSIFLNSPKFYDAVFKSVPHEVISLFTISLLDACYEMIEREKPDIVISSHTLLTCHIKLLQQGFNYKFETIYAIPDYGPVAPAIFPNIKYTRPERIIVLEEKTKNDIIKTIKMPKEDIFVVGHQARSDFKESEKKFGNKESAKIALKELLEQKGIKFDITKPTILIAGGAGDIIEDATSFIKTIIKEQKNSPELLNRQYIVICGYNSKFHSEISDIIVKNRVANIFPLGWINSQEFSLIQYATDFPILFSIGPGTFIELVTSKCGPLVIYRSKGGQEIPNREYAVNNGLGIYSPKTSDVIKRIKKLFSEDEYKVFANNADSLLARNVLKNHSLKAWVLKEYSPNESYENKKFDIENLKISYKIKNKWLVPLTLVGLAITLISSVLLFFVSKSSKPILKSKTKIKRSIEKYQKK